MKEICMTVNSLQILKYFVINQINGKIDGYYDAINLKIEIFAFDDKDKREIQDSINNIFRSTKNLYISLISENSWHYSPHRVLISMIPNDTIVSLEVFFNTNDLVLDFGSFKNLKFLSLRNFSLGSQILYLLNLARVCPRLEEIKLASDKTECANHNQSTADFLEKFLRTSISLIMEHHNIKAFTIESMTVILNYINMEPYKSYYEKIHVLLEQNMQHIVVKICSVEELQNHYALLQKSVKEANEVELSFKQHPDNIRLQELHRECQKNKNKIEADFIKLINFLIDNKVTDAQYYLAEFVDSGDPKEMYRLLSSIPSSSSFFRMANYKMAHLLLDFKNYQKIFPQLDEIDMETKIIQHLLFSGADKSLIANMLYEYFGGIGMPGDDNIFMQTPHISNKQPMQSMLETSGLQTLFMLGLARKSGCIKKLIDLKTLKKSASCPDVFKYSLTLS